MFLTKSFSCFFLLACASCLPSLYGPIIENIGADPFTFMMFNDGKNIVITYRHHKDAEIFENTGTTFTLKQVLTSTINSYDIWMTKDAKYLYLNRISQVLVLENMNGTFSIIQVLTDLSACISTSSSYDGEYLILGNATSRVLIYQLNGQYTLFQTITDSSAKIEGMPVTSDKSTIAMGGNDQFIRIYKMVGG